ncbi:MAG: glycosyltransferase family 39 protein [Anaerolineae bacterium]|nr:glycosyltransferase family 39 protein [Anaerolineae bacterium]
MTQNMIQQAWTRLKPVIKADLAWWFLIVVGIILRLRQYLTNRSFWADEASLAFNLVTRTFSGLTQPLDYHQGAPIGFLFIEKLSILALGNNEYTMRLFPLLSGIFAIYLLYILAKTHIGLSGLFALIAFSVGSNLIYYSSELKQYSSDVMIALLLVYLASRCIQEQVHAKDFLLLGIVGAVAIWVSHPSVFVLAGIGLVLVFEKLTRKDYVPFFWIFVMGIVWIGLFAVDYYVLLRPLAADEYLKNYWGKAFMPLPPWSDPGWFEKTFYSMLLMSLHTHISAVVIVPILLLIGSVSLFVRNRRIGLLFILPALLVLIASSFETYPLKDRFMLFLIPSFLLIISEGLRGIYLFAAKWSRPLGFVLAGLPVILLIWPPGTTLDQFAITTRGSDVRPVIEYVGENRTSDEIVYVFHAGESAFQYYAPLYGLDTGKVILGFSSPRKKLALEGFFNDVEVLRGKGKVWFIFSNIYDCGDCEGDMQEFYVEYLNEFGVMLDQFNAPRANAYLYDLSP